MKNKIIKLINNKAIFSIVLLFVMFLISFNIPLTADDYSFSFPIGSKVNFNSIIGIFESVKYNYLYWNGRILAYFISEIFLLGENQIIFRILYPIINLIIIFELNDLVFDGKDNSFLYVTSMMFLFSHILVLNQVMFWIVGWATYCLPLIFILPLIRYFKETCRKQDISIKKYILFIFSFAGSLFVEHYSLVILGISLFCALREIISNKKFKLTNTTIFFLLGALLGTLTIFLAPGLSYRAGGDLINDFALLEKFHFGWARFIYCFFYLNQRIFLLLSIVMIINNLKSNNRIVKFYSLLYIPIILTSLVIMLKPGLMSPVMCECLTGEWSYYTCELKNTIVYSTVVIYYILIFLINIIYISCKEHNFYIFVLYGASVMSSLCFVFSNMACERTQFISFVLLAIILLDMVSNDSYFKSEVIKEIFIIVSIFLFGLLSYKYITNYNKQFDIYMRNKQRYENCSLEKCKEVRVEEFDYRYVFKSDFNFEDQFNWQMNAIRKYHRLDSDCIILSFE